MRIAILAVVIGVLLGIPLDRARAQASAAETLAPASPPRTVFRDAQRSPTRERYQEIQTALKERGYDPGPVDGQWGPKTSSALKRFERDNDLRADGQLDSLTLIALGLGPMRLNSIARGPR